MDTHHDLERLKQSLAGKVIEPGTRLFEETSHIWNHRLASKPAAVIQCLDADDVAAAVKTARAGGFLIAVKGGGHSYAGLSACRNGFVIDLSRMKDIHIDPERRRVRVAPGVVWRELDEATTAHGLATPGGTVSTVGVAGFTLGGGSGYLSRLHGLAIDNLLSAEIVTAAGDMVTASESENPDLFWAIRGGGGNFGIVTEFEFRLHEVPGNMLAGQIMYPFEDAGKVLRAWREVMAEAPDAFTCFPCMLHVPPIPEFPEELHNHVVIDLVVGYAGDPKKGMRISRQLQGLGEPILNHVGPMPYTEVQRALDAGVPEGQRWYSRAHYMNELTDEAIDTFLAETESLPGPLTLAYFEPMGGAVSRLAPGATAFPHRNAAYGFHILAGWMSPEEDETIMKWAMGFNAVMQPHSTGGVYVNLLGEDEGDRVRNAYGDNWPALLKLKRKWDPDNLFSRNQNIPPG